MEDENFRKPRKSHLKLEGGRKVINTSLNLKIKKDARKMGTIKIRSVYNVNTDEVDSARCSGPQELELDCLSTRTPPACPQLPIFYSSNLLPS